MFRFTMSSSARYSRYAQKYSSFVSLRNSDISRANGVKDHFASSTVLILCFRFGSNAIDCLKTSNELMITKHSFVMPIFIDVSLDQIKQLTGLMLATRLYLFSFNFELCQRLRQLMPTFSQIQSTTFYPYQIVKPCANTCWSYIPFPNYRRNVTCMKI